MTPLALRAVVVVGYGTFAALHWALLIDPAERGDMLVGLALAMGLAGGLLALARVGRRLLALVAGIALIGVWAYVALRTAGVARELLAPARWDDLVVALGDGAAALPSIAVPYQGADENTHAAMILGGELIAAIGALAALRPRPGVAVRMLAVVALTALYTVPVVVMPTDQPLLGGLVCFAAIAALLWLADVPRRRAPAAAALAVAGAVAGLALAPALDRDVPWFDYESFASSLAPSKSTTYNWSHSYGPLDWPRDRREVLRIRARRAYYWKAENLDGFDGLRWVPNVVGQGRELRDELATVSRRHRPEQRLRVSVRALRSPEFIGAGWTLAIDPTRQRAVPGSSPGTWVGQPRLRRGDSYEARVAVPRPEESDLAAAGTDYPPFTQNDGFLDVALGEGVVADMPPFGSEGVPRITNLINAQFSFGTDRLTQGRYARTYELAQRLKRGAETPIEFARRIERHLAGDFFYSESPPVRSVPLEGFLFDDRLGYCQHFSGAMALLLRMGGVPARVVAGFSPGRLDRGRSQYVVRDVDAHSWVEAWFPGIGWVLFDPTPAASPARSQLDDQQESGGGSSSGLAPDPIGRQPAAPTGDLAVEGDDARSGGLGTLAIVALVLVTSLLAGGALLGIATVRRRREPFDPAAAVSELERAMRRTARPLTPSSTLSEVERRFRENADAAGYVAALRRARFGAGAGVPTLLQRVALRAELARGLGAGGRMRAFWALPPWGVGSRSAAPVRRPTI